MIAPATIDHIAACDQIARAAERDAAGSLGWVRRASMTDAIEKGTMNVYLSVLNNVSGFVIWSAPSRGANRGYHVIHTLAVIFYMQGFGVGRELLTSVPSPVRLKCPVTVGADDHPNPANLFYAACGMTLAGTDTARSGKLLNIWERT